MPLVGLILCNKPSIFCVMEDTNFLILLFYYNRPRLVKNALESIVEMQYENYTVCFIDDSDISDGENICRDFLSGNILKKFKFYTIGMSVDDKNKKGGSIFGKYANDAIRETESDVILMLCDDDALSPTYLSELDEFYKKNPNINWSYSYVKYFNPVFENYKSADPDWGKVLNSKSRTQSLNSDIHPVNPTYRKDMSQVSIKRKCFFDYDVWFPFPKTSNLDAAIFSNFYKFLGFCYPTKIFGQCKAVHDDQLGVREVTGNFYNIGLT
jgi:glycosyltransferase involved in cell wall biosynthesis